MQLAGRLSDPQGGEHAVHGLGVPQPLGHLRPVQGGCQETRGGGAQDTPGEALCPC